MAIANLFATYLFLSLIVAVVLKILPDPISSPFEVVGQVRQGISRLVLSVFKEEDNVEVTILGVMILPFVVFMMVFTSIQITMFTNTGFAAINLWLFLLAAFIIAFIFPSREELAYFNGVSTFSMFVLLFKLILGIQLLIDDFFAQTDLVVLFLWITPLSHYLKV